MLTLLALEFRKLFSSRSFRLAVIVTILLPFVWAFAPRLEQLGIKLDMISAWQMPAISIGVTIQYLLPLFIAVTVAEMVGSEVAQGTLAPLLLRPVDRTKVIAAKLIVALSYPYILITTTIIGSLLAGSFKGFGSFTGGTGLGPGLFVGVGDLTSGEAFLQVLRGGLLAAVALMPVAALSLLFAVLYLNTAAAALATFAALIVMRLLAVLPETVQRVLLTSHFGLYVQQGNIMQPLILLLIYTAGFGIMSIFAFDRRDV